MNFSKLNSITERDTFTIHKQSADSDYQCASSWITKPNSPTPLYVNSATNGKFKLSLSRFSTPKQIVKLGGSVTKLSSME